MSPKNERFIAVGYGLVRVSNKGGPGGLLNTDERRFVEQGFRSMNAVSLTLSMNPSTGDGGACFGDSGGPHFHGETIVSITMTGDSWCKSTDETYRVDTPWVHEFLATWI